MGLFLASLQFVIAAKRGFYDVYVNINSVGC